MNSGLEKTRNIVLCGLFIAVISICSWLVIPTAVPFTMQTFAIFASVLMLGTKWSSISIIAYIALGCFGLPIFAGFQSGPGVLFGPLGGYILGFLFISIVSGSILSKTGYSTMKAFISLLSGLILCYIFGTLWFMHFYSNSDTTGIIAILSMCVFPFIIPDILKIILSVKLYERVKKSI